jgi:hypothetical protein
VSVLSVILEQVADEVTRQQPHKPRFVGGSIGPTNRTASISPDVEDASKRYPPPFTLSATAHGFPCSGVLMLYARPPAGM